MAWGGGNAQGRGEWLEWGNSLGGVTINEQKGQEIVFKTRAKFHSNHKEFQTSKLFCQTCTPKDLNCQFILFVDSMRNPNLPKLFHH